MYSFECSHNNTYMNIKSKNFRLTAADLAGDYKWDGSGRELCGQVYEDG